MASITRRRRLFGRTKSEINITPLIDVVLVLIVIFMVISPTTPKGLEANIPQPSLRGSQKPHNETLILSLSRNGGIRLNREEVEAASIFSRLQDVLRPRSDRTVFVQADSDILYNDVAQLIDAARGAGADRVGLLTEQLTAR